MAQITLGIGTSHTPMLMSSPEDWRLNFPGRDSQRPQRDKEGGQVSFAELERIADPRAAPSLSAESVGARHQRAQDGIAHLSKVIADAGIDSLVIIGDDQEEMYHADNLPAFLIYWGQSIPNVPRHTFAPGDAWFKAAQARYYDDPPRDYPVDAALAEHMIRSLNAQDFDISSANRVVEGQGEGHAFGFVHKRLIDGRGLPIVPVFINTYYPPNQPSPRRCYNLGRAIRQAIESFPGDRKVGVLASGGLSHFTVDEDLDNEIIRAMREKDAEALSGLPVNKLEAGSSEIRNWICAAGALEHLDMTWVDYIPGYRTKAGTGTGICFAAWR
ncbi:MAG: hypothetical protein RIB84_17135 [Sneathiellaceae bacterium]